MARRITPSAPTPSEEATERNRKARYRLMDYRARHADEGATITAAEKAVWDGLAGRLAAAEDVNAEAAAREWAIAEHERAGVPQPVKISASQLRAVAG
ncbi:MAG TPA: hypothetical protein VFK14_12450 [Solirubrobacterales bacterium]|nr:hypothetical protein [Solirubrobacterales bacterium]